ncbi:class I adenylate-forming enzyme family protein [Pseudonocardia phyllosphaerae]|uniref:class I adenylate-forming enzyme family protein n=1 Tax=Pseudonocardia phyllosphaerae TaxID=3390502 RepID=UPI00397824F9
MGQYRQYLPPGQPSFHLDYPEHATAGDLLAGSARRFGDRVALRDGEETLTYAELYDAARRVAGGLTDLGIGPGATVALDQPNSLWFTVSYYGVLLAGAVVTPVNPGLPAGLVHDQLVEAGAVAAIAHPATLGVLAEAAVPGLRHTVVVPPSHAAPGEVPAGFTGSRLETLLAAEPAPRPATGPADVAQLCFTGGTTGRSKAVEITHRNVVANSVQTAAYRTGSVPRVDDDGGVYLEAVPAARTPWTPEPGTTRSVALAPFFHAMGLIGQNVAVLSGTDVTVFGRFDPVRFLDTLERLRVDQMQGSPALFHALLAVPGVEQRDLTSVRWVGTGAAPIETDTLARLARVFPNAIVVEGYGLTEATMALAVHPLAGPGVVPPGSVGAPLFDTELSIRSLTDGSELGPGEVGEIWARGPQIAGGYRNQPELTAEQFPGDGWLRTGDLGRLDDEGFLHLSGRAKDMLIYKGYNVYPAALEEVLVQHRGVAQAAVIGVPRDGVGEVPVAFVVPAASTDGTPGLAEEIVEHVAARVAPYARVREVRFVEALPTSAAGKVLKTELRASFAGTAAG